MKYPIGLIGLGVMGGSLARNIDGRGFPVAAFDRRPEKTAAFLSGPAKGSTMGAFNTPEDLAAALERPRRILMMVTAGPAVDSVVALVKPHLEAGDILIDGGNSLFSDTDRRTDEL